MTERKIAKMYKETCWDMITITVTPASVAAVVSFGKWIKTILPLPRKRRPSRPPFRQEQI